jgi:hypothetical protein
LTPILLGVVMGPIVEGRMRQALGGANGDLTIFVSQANLGDHGGGAGDPDRLHLPRLDQAPQCTRGLADQ